MYKNFISNSKVNKLNRIKTKYDKLVRNCQNK